MPNSDETQQTTQVEDTQPQDNTQVEDTQTHVAGDGETKTGEVQETPDVDPRVKRANHEAAKYRTQLRDAQKQNEELAAKLDQITKGLALLTGGSPEQTPEEQLKAMQQQNAQLAAELKETRLMQSVQDAATQAGLDAKLTVPLLKGTGSLNGLDPDKPTFKDDLQSIMDAVTDQFPQLKPAQQKSSGQPKKEYAPENGDGYLTLEDVRRLNKAGDYAAVNKAAQQGKIRY